MALRLVIIWFVLAAICGGLAFFLARAPRPALWLRVIVAGIVLILCAASFWTWGNEMEKTLGSAIAYFLVWSGVFGLSAASAGIVAGTLAALGSSGRALPTE
ncbi:hypothetical protein [Rhodopseudomonas sp. B29]|uniref:hypothetical protein n=1 Tax=Rhodopseudomonas sp. B29 TaxID=95607 RepID=UPI0003489F79|nr:hypothetical protein [Rhodopseudomonas sp. B29]